LVGAGLLVLLLGYGGWRVMQQRRRAASEEDTVFGDSSSMDTESFYGDGAGQQINTDANTSQQDDGNTSSLYYTPSQLDAGDVDPIEEAEVYMSYGRDRQAEEILREAVRTDPARLGLHLKLAEIYAKRNDKGAFENVAKTLRNLTQGEGSEWEALQNIRRGLDHVNTSYQSPDAKTAPAAVPPPVAQMDGVSDFFASSQSTRASGGSAESTQFVPPPAVQSPPAPAASADGANSLFTGGLPSSLSLDDFLSSPASAPATAATAPAVPTQKPPAADDGLHLDLDLDSGDIQSVSASNTTPDPFTTKVELAKEFNAIGDSEGARALLEEVLAESPDNSPAKIQARHLLDEMK